ncbi:hypothetical protein BKA64DRAFT_767704, partial [Cadophora sp. MPI-SDFR-AT-0126]
TIHSIQSILLTIATIHPHQFLLQPSPPTILSKPSIMMHFSVIASSILAFVAFVDATAIAIPINEMTVSEPFTGSIFKRDHYMSVSGSGGTRLTNGGNSLTVSVSCGTVTASNIDTASGSCTANLVGTFTGCDGCEFYGDFPTFSLRLSTKCGNAHIAVNTGYSNEEGGGDIGENLRSHDCTGKPDGSKVSMNICAGDNWSLREC